MWLESAPVARLEKGIACQIIKFLGGEV